MSFAGSSCFDQMGICARIGATLVYEPLHREEDGQNLLPGAGGRRTSGGG